MSYLEAICIAIIEGLTEFLPVSSTAHMIFTSTFFGIQEDGFVKMFQVSIQFGAILAVVVLYKSYFFSSLSVYIPLAIGVIPALLLGALFDDAIDHVLEKPVPIAIALIIGGIVFVFLHRIFIIKPEQPPVPVTGLKAFKIGLWQCLALMPGTSRAAACLIGGMQQGLSRQQAAEFSFFLAVPTLLAVTFYSLFIKSWHQDGSLIKGFHLITESHYNLILFILGNLIAFGIALIAVKYFIRLLTRYGLQVWGWYRIAVGLIMLFLLH
jgi:undecaprenyl-diphosphatase